MNETSLAPAGPPRHGLVDGALGAAVALIAITVANAALPDATALPAKHPPVRIAAARVAACQPLAAPPAPALIAFHPPLPDGYIGSPFGLRQLPWEEKARLHAGVDLEAPEPEAVLAAADGVVTRMGQDPGYGRFVELAHADGLTTLYGHMERFDPVIRPGAAVKAGVPVGRIGSTGSSTGVHLHFEIRDGDGRPLNPELLVGRSFATAADLPLREARRVPRLVRIAYVSRIPKAKQAEMQDRAERQQALQQLAMLKAANGRVRAVITPKPSAPSPAPDAAPPEPVF